MTKEIRIVNLGDVHWGAVPPDRLEREFNEILFPWLEANAFDALIQLGDWFDKRLSLDSEDAKAAMRVMVRLCQLCQTVRPELSLSLILHHFQLLVDIKCREGRGQTKCLFEHPPQGRATQNRIPAGIIRQLGAARKITQLAFGIQ